MSIIRVKKEGRYFACSNEPVNDPRLSWEAKGVLCYLLSKPDDWTVNNTDLVKRGPAGVKKIEAILRELKKYGYVRRYKFRGEKGKFLWVSEVYESPSLNPALNTTIPPKQVDGLSASTIPPLPSNGLPSNGLPSNGLGGDITSTESPNTDEINTERENAHTQFYSSSDSETYREDDSSPSLLQESESNSLPVRKEDRLHEAISIYRAGTGIRGDIKPAVLDFLREVTEDTGYTPDDLRKAVKEADKIQYGVLNYETLLNSYESVSGTDHNRNKSSKSLSAQARERYKQLLAEENGPKVRHNPDGSYN